MNKVVSLLFLFKDGVIYNYRRKKSFIFFGVRVLLNVSRYFIGFLIALILWVPNQISAVPLENAFDKGQAKNHLEMNRPWDSGPPVFYDLDPHLSEKINEPHPAPAYISRNKYNQLLNIEPVNQVQSRIFNKKIFESLQRIGVLGFENKTIAPFEDKKAGEVISRHAYNELKKNN